MSHSFGAIRRVFYRAETLPSVSAVTLCDGSINKDMDSPPFL